MNIKKENSLVFWLFLAPVLVAFFVVIVVPFFMGVFYSFTNWSSSAKADGGLRLIGLQNYIASFKDPAFAHSFGVTIAYTILNMIVINFAAFSLALLVTSKIRLRKVYRVGFFVPNLIGGLILGYVWQFLFNNAIPFLGNTIPMFAALARPENLMLGKANSAVIALVIVGTWQYAGYIMMIYIAAIENVPVELHEAAMIDGATPLQRLRSITLPMAAQAFTVTMFLTLVQSFKQFDVNVSLTSGGPSTMFLDTPVLGTELLALNIYNTAFLSNKLSEGQARAVVFFLVLAVIALVQVAVNKKKELEL
ncbi:MAG: sugar ABC transporter permease [Spirochaetales bacterium]|nr:MAG: sugar ABC transporter permease [Spirochaetales bacterium]